MKFEKNEVYYTDNETVERFVSLYKSIDYYVICNGNFIPCSEDVMACTIKEFVRYGRNKFILTIAKE